MIIIFTIAVVIAIVVMLTFNIFAYRRDISGSYAKSKIDSAFEDQTYIESVSRAISTDMPELPITVGDIIPGPKYRSLKYLRFPLHVGQFKLFLSEVQFLVKLRPQITRGEIQYVIYVGSGPGITRQVLADLFPTLKFVLFDPQEHFIAGSNSKDMLYYRIPDVENVANSDLVPATAKTSSARTVNIATKKGIAQRSKRTALLDSEKLTPDEIAQSVIKEAHTFHIIEDLFTDEFARALHIIGDKSVFISDIRTKAPAINARASIDDDSPDDIDILANNAMQHIWTFIINPRACMLKFRTPFMNSPKIYQLVDRPFYKSALDAYKKLFARDLIKDYEQRTYWSLRADYLNLQAYVGPSSTETRLIVVRAPNNASRYAELAEYSPSKHEDALFAYNLLREFAFSSKFARFFNEVPGYDGCPDCHLAMTILTDYYSGNADAAFARFSSALELIGRRIKDGFHGARTKPLATIIDAKKKILARNVIHCFANNHLISPTLKLF